MKAKVLMKLVTKDGKERIRDLTMLRKNLDKEGGEQRYFIYFYKPPDVKDMTFMVWKYPGKDDDRWLFIPAINLVKRIAANDKRSSFVGSDFSYEDVSGRGAEEDNHSILKEEAFNGKDTYVIKSVPKDEGSVDYSYKVSWIDKESFIPLKEEYYDKRGELYKVFTADELRTLPKKPSPEVDTLIKVVGLLFFFLSSSVLALDVSLHGVDISLGGFLQGNYTPRIVDGNDFILAEERFQLKLEASYYGVSIFTKTDVFYDAVGNEVGFDIREAYLDYFSKLWDVRVGRQIITWGVGDLRDVRLSI